jgi:hypothetical protein
MTRGSNLSSLRTAAVLAACCLPHFAYAEDLAGAWSLQQYEMRGKNQVNVSGLLVMTAGTFGMVYTMGSEEAALSGRAHAGGYAIEQGQLTFDVEWWVENVDGVARTVPPGQEAAEIDFDASVLTLRFGSGSLQRWRRVESDPAAEIGGAWRLEDVRDAEGSHNAAGLLVIAEDRFAFVHSVDPARGKDASYFAYAGSSDGGQANLVTNWSVSLEDGRGDVTHEEKFLTASSMGQHELSLTGDDKTWLFERLP